ncbi:MAG: YhdP family protein [Rhodocyclaceae bacterium]|nr:YhdP family protein [Rhodocyclaceae bacterium]
MALYFAAALLILTGRYLILPEIAAYRGAIEQQLSSAIGLPVKIGALTAEWPGLHPRLAIKQLQVHDSAGRPALSFDHVDAEIGWASLWHFSLRLSRLEIVAPALDVRRTADGVIYVAGLLVQGDGESDFADWLLKQDRIIVRDARIVWHDEQRGTPPLELQQLHFELKNSGRHHSFGLSAEPPAELASRLDLRGNLVGRDPDDLSAWRGEIYADVERIDLAAWAPWFDTANTPVELTRGLGGLRLWLSFENLLATGFTADLRLADLAVRFSPNLPVLSLRHLEGRLAGRRTSAGLAGEIKRLALATADGIVLPPTDASLKLNTGEDKGGGEFRANGLDLAAMTALARYLPLPDGAHARLQAFMPRGLVSGIEMSWRGSPTSTTSPARWQVKGRFADLGLAAHKELPELPGFTGLSGRLDGDERSGQIHLDSQNARIELPKVFAEPSLMLTHLAAEIGWQVPAAEPGQFDLSIARLAFTNPDASGEVTGRYRYTGQGPGEIDLSAKLTRGDGMAVWRYMPLAVSSATREWLRTGIVGGQSSNATLRLKGPLAHFPFRDGKQGIFQVKGAFQGATLDYATGWPKITGIDGELLFEGARMLIRGQRATLSGVKLSNVTAEIPDLEHHEEILTVNGRASGATQQFFDFIEASPVGERIDHFTQTMTASGRGELDLKLVFPLRHMADTQVQGRYRFADNQLRVLPELPPFTAAQGELSFTGDRLQAKNLLARLLGAPVTLDVSSAPGGVVRVTAVGTLSAQALRQEYGQQDGQKYGGGLALEHLSGETAWRATVEVKKPGAEIRIESNLVGLASSLPEPFNKSARDSLNLRVDGRIEPNRDDWTARLGQSASLRLQQAGSKEAWRGRIALGEAAAEQTPTLPARGVTLAITQPRLDLDAWRRLQDKPVAGEAKPAVPALSLAALELQSAELLAFGRTLHDVRLSGVRAAERWRFTIASREAQGQLQWDGDVAGAGRITGRFAHLTLPASEQMQPAATGVEDAGQEMPAIDLQIDNFKLRDMSLGEVKVAAENRAGAWRARLDVKNDAAHLTGEGRWRPGHTALSFKLDANNAEKLLGRLGLPDAMRRGAAIIEGDVNWSGTPFAFDLPSLAGNLKIEATKGQFKRLEPGVGRLLGVLSLQSLPRRITLDFRDIFSEGFAFDSITGTAQINRGLMKTDELNIRGPAGRVLLAGQVNLLEETQDLKVRVQPAVGESIAVGAMIVNPVAGAVAWAAQKVLGDPLDQAFAFEYAVSGPWSDPKVEKLIRLPPAENRLP